MSSTGAGYDSSCSQFSPDGRIYQVEYAMKAVETSGTAVGIKCKDGIVLGIEKPMVSKMLVGGSNRRIFGVNKSVGGVIAGLSADGRQIINRAREEAQSYKETYGHSIIPSVLANRLGLYAHFYTLHYSLRPFGANLLFAGMDEDVQTPELYMLEPSGIIKRYFGCAAGKGAQAANTEIEKLYVKCGGFEGITCVEAVKKIAQIIYTVRDASNDKPIELEMGWLTEANNYEFKQVPRDLVAAADAFGREHATPFTVTAPAAPAEEGAEESKMETEAEEGPVAASMEE